MKSFSKVIKASFDINTNVTGEVWALERGYKEQPHRAASVVARINENRANFLLHSRYEMPTAQASFYSFTRTFRQHHPYVQTVATCTDDVATYDVLRRARLSVRRPPRASLPMELVLNESLSLSDIAPWLDVISAASLLALEEEAGLSWV